MVLDLIILTNKENSLTELKSESCLDASDVDLITFATCKWNNVQTTRIHAYTELISRR